MINFKTLGLLLFCFYLSSSWGSHCSAQLLFASPQNRQPIFNGRIIQQRPVQTQQNAGRFIQGQNAQQGRIVQRQPVQRQQVVPQRVQQTQFVDPQFFYPSKTTQRRIIQGKTQIQRPPISKPASVPSPVPPKASSENMGLARAKIAELNDEIEELTEQNSELQSAKEDSKKLEAAEAKIEELNKSIEDLEEENAELQSAKEDNKKLEAAEAEIEELNKSVEDLKEKNAELQSAKGDTKKLEAAEAKIEELNESIEGLKEKELKL